MENIKSEYYHDDYYGKVVTSTGRCYRDGDGRLFVECMYTDKWGDVETNFYNSSCLYEFGKVAFDKNDKFLDTGDGGREVRMTGRSIDLKDGERVEVCYERVLRSPIFTLLGIEFFKKARTVKYFCKRRNLVKIETCKRGDVKE